MSVPRRRRERLLVAGGGTARPADRRAIAVASGARSKPVGAAYRAGTRTLRPAAYAAVTTANGGHAASANTLGSASAPWGTRPSSAATRRTRCSCSLRRGRSARRAWHRRGAPVTLETSLCRPSSRQTDAAWSSSEWRLATLATARADFGGLLSACRDGGEATAD